jgi:ribosomal protein L7/L12
MIADLYFHSFKNYFWQPEEDGSVIAIPGGSTIAYTGYVNEVIEGLSLQGLPPSGALMLALIATNKSMGDDLSYVFGLMQGQMLNGENTRRYYERILEDSEAVLNTVQLLPDRYKTGDLRIHLLRVFFEACHGVLSKVDSKKISESLNNSLKKKGRKNWVQATHPVPDIVFTQDFRCIALLRKKFPDLETLQAKLNEVPVIEETLAEKINESSDEDQSEKSFQDQLLENPKTFQVAALLKYLWSGMNIPMHLATPGDQPLGGISDLSNKGDFDKLLISEFANDDIVLMSRLANNEALYIKRESPPAEEKHERVLLIDASLKNWGTPKLIAHAVALAVSRHPKTDIPCKTFIVGKEYKQIGDKTPEEVIEGLQLVEGVLNCAEGLESYFAENKYISEREIFLIAAPDALMYHNVQKVITDNYKSFRYWINTAADGRVEVFKNQNGSRKKLQEIRLDLEKAWEKPVEQGKQNDELVLISDNKYPLLFPLTPAKKVFYIHDYNEYYVISEDRKLFKVRLNKNNYPESGYKLIREKLPTGSTEFEMGLKTNGDLYLLCFQPQGREVTIFNLTKNTVKSIIFKQWKPHITCRFIFKEDSFWYRGPGYISEITPDAGKVSRFDEENSDLLEACNRRHSQLEEIQKLFNFNIQIQKNVHTVYINADRNLVINKHELKMDSSGNIRWFFQFQRPGINTLVTATRTGNVFSFPDESQVEIDPSGFYILRPGNKSNAHSFCDLVLEEQGSKLLQLTHILNHNLDLDLSECKKIASASSPVIIKSGIKRTQAEYVKESLKEIGAKATIKEFSVEDIWFPPVLDAPLAFATRNYFAGNKFYQLPDSRQMEMSTRNFYAEHIVKFIDRILNHATKN